MIHNNWKSLGSFIAIFIVSFLFMPVSVSYSFSCCVGGNGVGCFGETQSQVKMTHRNSTILGRKIPFSIAGNKIHLNPTRRDSAPFVQSEESYDFTGALEGDWEYVVGYVCIKIDGGDLEGDFYACLVQFLTDPLGNNEYQIKGWKKKVLWIDIGNGVPLFIFGNPLPPFEVNGVTYTNVYQTTNIDYYDRETKTVYNCNMWLDLNDQDEMESYWISMFDQEGELVNMTQLEVGEFLYADEVNCSWWVERRHPMSLT